MKPYTNPLAIGRVAISLSAVLGVVLVFASTANAVVISHDPFAYSPVGSDLLGKNGGIGWNGAWIQGGFNASIFNNYDIAAGSLTFQNLLTSDERTSTTAQNAISGLRRPFMLSLNQNDTATRYLSVLMRPEGTLHGGAFSGFFGLYLDSSPNTGDQDLYIGKPGGGIIGSYVVEQRGGGGQVVSPVSAVVGETALLVLKAEFRPGNDRFTLYVNPTPGGPEPTTGTLKQDMDIGFMDGIVLYSTGAHSVDEIRWGNTFADVTPVPEPGTIVLAVAGIAAMAMLFRRRPRGVASQA